MDKITVKTPPQIEIMREGGRKLARIKKALKESIKVGGGAKLVEEIARNLIEKEGGEASFMKVPNYKWATCVNLNSGLVHGIPKKEIVFKKGDVVSVDVGFFYKGFHTDTSFSLGLGVSKEVEDFLETGRKTLEKAIKKAQAGNRIYDISKEIEEGVSSKGYSPVRALVGHGVGKNLHEAPQIPCFTQGNYEDSPKIVKGMVLAIEVMYAMGESDVKLDKDGWTISMRDAKISALYEETVAVTSHGPLVLTG